MPRLSPSHYWRLCFPVLSCIVNACWEHILIEQRLHILVPVEHMNHILKHVFHVFLVSLPTHCASMAARIKEVLPNAATAPLSVGFNNVNDLGTNQERNLAYPVITFIVLFLKRQHLHHFEIAVSKLQLHHC